jgi:hypothetical protein
MEWVRVDGQRSAQNPVLAQQFEIDRTVCLGERQKASLSGVTVASGGIAAVLAAQDRANSADTVARGCMAEKGYLMVPQDQAEAKLAELAAINEQKHQQEAPPLASARMIPRKPPAKPPAVASPQPPPAS